MNRLSRKLSRPGSSLGRVPKLPVLEIDLAEKPQHLEVPKTPDTQDFPDSLPLSTPTTLGSACSVPTAESSPNTSILNLPPSLRSEHSRCTTEAPDISRTGRIVSDERPPPWDRSNELVWTRHIASPEMEDREAELAFGENLARLARDLATARPDSPLRDASSERPGDGMTSSDHHAEFKAQFQAAREHKSPYFQPPDAVRFKIMKYLLAGHNHHDKPIRMNHPVFLCEVWPVSRFRRGDVESANYFDSLQSVLSSLESYTSVCPAMRADVLATLFLTRRFHVVYSPHVRTGTQPAATHYMDRYGPLMASITLEVDFTKLAGGWQPECVHYNALWGLKGVKALLEEFVQHQLTRHSTTIRDLRVLVRRYHGFRPELLSESAKPNRKENHHHPTTPPSPSPSPPSSTLSTNQSPTPNQTSPQPQSSPQPTPTPTPQRPIPYTPTAHIAHTLSPLKSLGPLVSSLTLTGVPHSFAAELISALSGRPLSMAAARRARARAKVRTRARGAGAGARAGARARAVSSTSSTSSGTTCSSTSSTGVTGPTSPTSANSLMTKADKQQPLRHVCYRVAAVEYPLLEGQRAVVGLRAGGGVVVVVGGVEGEMVPVLGGEMGERIGEESGVREVIHLKGSQKRSPGRGSGGKGMEVECLEEEEAGEKLPEVGVVEGDAKAVRKVRRARTVRKLSRELGGLSLKAKSGRGREVVRVVDRSLDVETRKGESPGRRGEAQQGEETAVKKRSRVGSVARSLAHRMASGGRKGLFGQY